MGTDGDGSGLTVFGLVRYGMCACTVYVLCKPVAVYSFDVNSAERLNALEQKKQINSRLSAF